ncbi:MAG: ABC transporter permease [Candidatus Thermoplasmatota archaeon]|nr:ABC transporter permease [Candidatus Thermoplasmatota archaeon]
MKTINWTAIYVMWLREMKRFARSKSRVVGTLAMPLMFLVFIGFGFSNMTVGGAGGASVSYIQFLVPGIVGMNLLFTSMFAGISVLWDREFGFLKEIMVAPVNRISIMLGRTAGGATTAILQGMAILLISMLAGFKILSGSIALSILLSLAFMVLVSIAFIGLGLIFASNMKDMQGFQLIMNFIIFPLFFLSGALYQLENLPAAIRYISYADPLTYAVDGMRGALLGLNSLPIALDIGVLAGFSLVMVFLGAYFFEKSESV